MHLRIVSVNDVYSLENLPRLKTLVSAARRGVDRLLVTLAGDFVAPSVLSSLDSGRGMVECLNAVGVTHVTFGNHEDDVPHAELLKRMAELGAVWLATNVHGFDRALPASDVITVGDDGPRVGLVGVVLRDPLVYRHVPFGATLEDPNEAALAEAARLVRDERCACVLALTHQSANADRALARAQHGSIAVILGGHEHTALDESIEGVRILKAGSEATHAAIVDLVFADPHAAPAISARLEPVQGYPEDAALRALVERHMRPVHELESATLLQLAPGEVLSSVGARARQTTLGAMICSRLRDVLGADAAVFNGGGIRAARRYEGRFTYGDLEAELPFDNEVVTVVMPGHVLEDAVRASRARAPDEDGAFLQVDDRMGVDDGGRALTRVAGAPFDPLRAYRVAAVRELFFGLDHIAPLVRYAAEFPYAIPPSNSSRTPREILVHAFSVSLWKQLGGFSALDADRDGKVTAGEVAAALVHAHHGDAPGLLSELMIHALDADRDDAVSREDAEERGE